MPTANHSPAPSSGARRMTAAMFDHMSRADTFTGVPRGTARPFLFLAAFQEAEPYLGLPVHAAKLVSWLVKKTQPQDWEEGSRPIAWPPSREQEEFLGLSKSQVKALNRTLFEAGIFVIRDDPQGQRYGRRDKKTNRIIEAYGFDLSPLAQRYDEFVRKAADAKIERQRMKELRRRVTIARRTIRQIGEELAAVDAVPVEWHARAEDVAALVTEARKAHRSEELTPIIRSLERRLAEAQGHLPAACRPVSNDPEGPENRLPNTTTTLKDSNLTDTVIAIQESSRVEPSVSERRTQREPQMFPEYLGLTSPASLLDLAPRLAPYLPPRVRDISWPAIIEAADWLRGEMGISPGLWARACQAMGCEYAAAALALVSTRPAEHFTSGAGGYFAGMLKKYERGELHRAASLWKLRDQTYGRQERSPSRSRREGASHRSHQPAVPGRRCERAPASNPPKTVPQSDGSVAGGALADDLSEVLASLGRTMGVRSYGSVSTGGNV
jgi:replication initiation protein RepC